MGYFSVIFISCVFSLAGADDGRTYSAVCQPYCDILGYFHPSQLCWSSYKPVYCCGNEHDRFCCYDPDLDVEDFYPPVNTCPRSSWWLYHWRIIISLLGTLMVVLLCTACFYYCCVSLLHHKRTSAARARRDRNMASSEDGEPGGSTEPESAPPSTVFNPQSPYAFSPPEYNSLPNDPPKYSDICSQQEGCVNPAFTLSHEECDSMNHQHPGPPPPVRNVRPEEGASSGRMWNEPGNVYIVSSIPDDPPPAYEPSEPLVDEETDGDRTNQRTDTSQPHCPQEQRRH